MRPASDELTTHLASEVTTLAICWKITRRDNRVLGFTSHDSDITYDSVIYKASSGFTPSAVADNAELAVDNLDIEGVLDSSAITETDLHAGLYDYAQIDVFMVNYNDLTQGQLMLRSGWLGEVRYTRNRFVAEVRGLMQNLSQTIGELYSPSCRAQFGDSRCGVSLVSYTVTGSLTTVTDNQTFSDSGRSEEDGYFGQGKITFVSGNNSGVSMEVKEFEDGKMTLVFPLPFDVQVGDSYSLHACCDKSFETCIASFDNAVNFRGEPHIPGLDKMFETAGTRSR